METQQEQTVRTPAAQQQTPTGKFCRHLFTAIFYLQLTLISILVIYLTVRGLIITKSPNFHPKKWFTPLLTSVAVSGVLSLLWHSFFVCNMQATIKATLWFTPLLTISVGIFLIVYGSSVVPGISLLLVLCSFFQTWYGCLRVNSRRTFNFKIISIATGQLPERTRAIAIVSLTLSMFYSGFMVVGIGGATSTRKGLRDILFISLIVISFAWTMQVLKNVQEVAISKATYVYFARDEFMNACDALDDTLRNKLGSVCIGSTLVPVFVLIRGTIRSCNHSDRAMYASNRDCYWIANHMVLWGNRYGFVHVGVYGKSFVKASSDTWRTFRRMTGLEELVDSDITSSICFLSAIATGAISALTSGIWSLLIHKDYLFQLTIYAFIIGYFVGRVGSAWLQACVLGYYVAYSEDPQSGSFDNTIPLRIKRQDVENDKFEAQSEVRQEEEEVEMELYM